MKQLVVKRLLSVKELEDVIEKITNKVQVEIINANRLGYLEEVLKKYEVSEDEYFPCEKHLARILVIGQSSVNKTDLLKVIKKYKIDEKHFEFVLDYSDIKNYCMENLRYNNKYSDVFVGPIPHKTNSMGNCSSIIARMEASPLEFPKLTKLTNGNELKITKQSFEKALLGSQLYSLML